MPKTTRVREKHIHDALARLNGLRGKKYPDIGYTYFGDVKGDGVSTPTLWVIQNEGGGVGYAYDLRGDTLRQTLNKIERAIELHGKV